MIWENINPGTGAQRPLLVTLLLSSGIVGSSLFTVFYMVEASLAPGFNSMQQAISDLELVKNGWLQSANFVMLGVFMAMFAIGLYLELKRGILAIILPVFQGLVASGLILSGLFIHDPFHTIASMIAFISLVIGFFLFAWLFYNDNRWKGWAIYSIVSAILMMTLLAMFGISKSSGGPAGLYERLAVAVRSLWSLLFTVKVMCGARLSQPKEQKVAQVIKTK
jgi:hypothetical membrane protein